MVKLETNRGLGRGGSDRVPSRQPSLPTTPEVTTMRSGSRNTRRKHRWRSKKNPNVSPGSVALVHGALATRAMDEDKEAIAKLELEQSKSLSRKRGGAAHTSSQAPVVQSASGHAPISKRRARDQRGEVTSHKARPARPRSQDGATRSRDQRRGRGDRSNH